MPLRYESIINSFQPSQRDPGIAGLMMEVLVLEDRLNALNERSEYFRWSLQSHIHRHAGLLAEYDRRRSEFNRYTASHFRDEKSAQN